MSCHSRDIRVSYQKPIFPRKAEKARYGRTHFRLWEDTRVSTLHSEKIGIFSYLHRAWREFVSGDTPGNRSPIAGRRGPRMRRFHSSADRIEELDNTAQGELYEVDPLEDVRKRKARLRRIMRRHMPVPLPPDELEQCNGS